VAIPPTIPREAAQAVLTIDLGALAANWRMLADRVAPAQCAAVVKADGYGIGLEQAVGALSKAGCRTFFVAHPSEGARARNIIGADDPGYRIYVLNGWAWLNHGDAFTDFGLRPVLSSLDDIRAWRGCSTAAGVGLPAAVQIDTGMHRLGLPMDAIAEARDLVSFEPYAPEAGGHRGPRVVALAVATKPATAVAARRKMAPTRSKRTPIGVYVDLVMSHFVSSEIADDTLNWRQMNAFRKIAHEFPGVTTSLANSSGIFLPQHPFHDLVRPGYALYGGNPTPGEPNPMRHVVTLQAPILQLREIAEGETVGYNAQWTAKRPTRLATIGVGYADGLPRALMSTDSRPGGEAIVMGIRCPFAGRVSMDLTVIDVTDVPHELLAPGLMIELLGEHITVDDMGARAGTIGYEVLTSLGRRYRREYAGA
jgi:alanine racemase